MKLAIISDIHGNMDAFREVLKDIDRCCINAILCLGDCIGYGPEPEEVITEVRRLNIPCILGNHELVLTDRLQLEWFNPSARESLIKTFAMLSGDSVEFICTLKTVMIANEFRFVHGFPPDSPTTYMFQVSESKLRRTFMEMKQRVCFIGHTHELEIIGFDGKTITRTSLKKGVTFLYPEKKYIINAGSVGQPRDVNKDAKYLILDTLSHVVETRFVPYNIKAVVEKIRKAGLPEAHAQRLMR